MDKVKENVPDQEEGGKTDTHHSVTKTSLDEAKKLYSKASERLLDVNHWHELCGKASAKFTLTDENGNEVESPAQIGNFFKINIPAPGTISGEGRDWVRIEAIDHTEAGEDREGVVIRVRPAPNPTTPGEDVAHFFKDDATSSFAVEREGNKVTASVHGRNEKPNTETANLLDKARNTLVALGAIIGLSNPQWKSLVKGVLEDS